MSQLPAFLAYVLGSELRSVLIVLVVFVLLLNVRRALARDD